MSQWVAGLGEILRKAKVVPHTLKTKWPMEIRQTHLGVWVILSLARNLKAGLRLPFDPAGFRSLHLIQHGPTSIEITAHGGFGKYHVRLILLDSPGMLLRCTTTLTPCAELKIEAMPRDMCFLNGKLDPYPGEARLLTCQTGNTAPQMFLLIPGSPGGTVFYFQNVTALSDFVRQTGADLAGCVAAHWPDAGFAVPAAERSLAKDKPVVIQDAFVELYRGVTEGDASASECFLSALGRIYPLLGQPEFEFYDWPALAKKSLHALVPSTGCCRMIKGRLYVQAYVNSSEKPPESMVQGAIIVPLNEYAAWQQRPVPLLDQLRHVPTSFYDPKIKSPVRWLPDVKFDKEERSEEQHHYLMDSWYLLHTLMNLGRMAEMGDDSARTVFLDSLATVIRVAHHFGYDWPVFFDQRTLKVCKAETCDGEGGEQDAAGLYVHIMLQAHDFTQEQRYLEEAERSAKSLECLAFGILYQTNTTAFTAVALARLWRITGKTHYKDLSIVCLASILSHLWLWHFGPDTRTFMALPPLHDAPYVAFYEEGEILAALQTWEKTLGVDVPEGVSLLLAEYQKHLLSRARYYFPTELPPEALAEEPKEGPIHPRLAMPLEGVGPTRDKIGTVGQAVYAGAAAFVLVTRCWHRPSGVPFMVFCNYPIAHLEFEGNRRHGTLKLRLTGSPLLSCLIRLFPTPRNQAVFHLSSSSGRTRWHSKGPDGWSANVPGGSKVEITW
jgi:hypothetical protein